MQKEFIYLYAIILFYIIQRVSELWINNQHENILFEEYGATELDPNDSSRMRLFHSLWFLALIVEASLHGKLLTGNFEIIIFTLLIIGQIIRFHTINTLGIFWTIKVYHVPNRPIINEGLFRYVLHPNYLVVILELILVPLLIGAPVTMILFSIGNIYILKKRIELEEKELLLNSKYQTMFKQQKRFIPFIF